MGKNSLLLQPIKVGNLTLKNRIMFPTQTIGFHSFIPTYREALQFVVFGRGLYAFCKDSRRGENINITLTSRQQSENISDVF